MSLALTKAIIARVRGVETLSGDAAQAQADVETLFGGTARIGYGMAALNPALPRISMYEDAGIEALGGVDVGIVSNSIYRFECWCKDDPEHVLPGWADAMERLFDQRRGAPDLSLDGDNRFFWSDLFVPFQGPLFDTDNKLFYGLLSIRFVEARP